MRTHYIALASSAGVQFRLAQPRSGPLIFMAWFGIPVLIASWLLWRFQAKQVANIEAAYAQYLASLSA